MRGRYAKAELRLPVVPPIDDLGHVVREFRLSHRLTQRALAAKAGLPQPTVARLELARDVQYATVYRVLRTLEGVARDDLVPASAPLRSIAVTRVRSLRSSDSFARAMAFFEKHNFSFAPMKSGREFVGIAGRDRIAKALDRLAPATRLDANDMDVLEAKGVPEPLDDDVPIRDYRARIESAPLMFVRRAKTVRGIVTPYDLLSVDWSR